jgi:hypothetical protein
MFRWPSVEDADNERLQLSRSQDDIQVERASNFEQRSDAQIVPGFSARDRALANPHFPGHSDLAQILRKASLPKTRLRIISVLARG